MPTPNTATRARGEPEGVLIVHFPKELGLVKYSSVQSPHSSARREIC